MFSVRSSKANFETPKLTSLGKIYFKSKLGTGMVRSNF